MAGYDRDRFVGVSDDDLDELSCTICQNILCRPVVTQCCLQMFCKDCIYIWLDSSTTCPYDRKILTTDRLCRPPRVVMNMLSNLKISCDFKDNGCPEVMSCEGLTKHTVNCPFNDIKNLKFNKISKSSDRHKTGGNSILVDMKQYKKLIQENLALKHDLDDLLIKYQQMEINLKNNLLTTNQLPDTLNVTPSGLLWPQIIDNKMDEEVTQKVMTIFCDTIQEEMDISLVCQKLIKDLTEEYDYEWHCSVIQEYATQAIFIYEPGYWIQLKFGLQFYIIYKTQFFGINGNRVQSNKIWKAPCIYKWTN